MRNEILNALNRQQELQRRAADECRELSDSEQREFDALQAKIDAARNESGGEGSESIGGSRQSEPTEGTNAPEGGRQAEEAEDERTADGAEQARGFTPTAAAAILAMCRHFDIDAEPYIKRGLSEDEARREVMAELMKRNSPIGTGIQIIKDEGDKFRAAAVDGLLLRAGVEVNEPAAGANRYRDQSLRAILTECCEREQSGRDFRHMSADSLYIHSARDFYNPEAAFPSILDDVIQKAYVAGLKKAGTKFDQFVKFGTLSNFKKTTNHEYIMSLGGELEKIPENGELPAMRPTDVRLPERQLDTYGTQFTMSRKAFIDDDIGLLTSMPVRYAAMSQRTQNRLVYEILLNKTKCADGKTMFHADHKNSLATGTGMTLAAIKKMIFMIGMQKDEAGNQLALTPDLFIVPLGMGADVYSLLASPTIHTTENTQAANPYRYNDFTVVEDVSLNAMAGNGAVPWFMGVKKEFIQVDYLNGQREANIRRSEQAGKLGFVWDVYHDFAVTPMHTQTIARNPGVEITGD